MSDEIQTLIELLFSDNEWHAIAAAKKLGQLRASEAIQALQQRLQETDSQIAELDRQAHLAYDKGDHRGAMAIAEHLIGDMESLRIEIARALETIGDQ